MEGALLLHELRLDLHIPRASSLTPKELAFVRATFRECKGCMDVGERESLYKDAQTVQRRPFFAGKLVYLEGRSVIGDGGREIFLIQNGKKRSFPDYETFLKMGFTDKGTKHVNNSALGLRKCSPCKGLVRMQSSFWLKHSKSIEALEYQKSTSTKTYIILE